MNITNIYIKTDMDTYYSTTIEKMKADIINKVYYKDREHNSPSMNDIYVYSDIEHLSVILAEVKYYLKTPTSKLNAVRFKYEIHQPFNIDDNDVYKSIGIMVKGVNKRIAMDFKDSEPRYYTTSVARYIKTDNTEYLIIYIWFFLIDKISGKMLFMHDAESKAKLKSFCDAKFKWGWCNIQSMLADHYADLGLSESIIKKAPEVSKAAITRHEQFVDDFENSKDEDGYVEW